MRIAQQMCTVFVEAVRPFAEGMISRYDDTYDRVYPLDVLEVPNRGRRLMPGLLNRA